MADKGLNQCWSF